MAATQWAYAGKFRSSRKNEPVTELWRYDKPTGQAQRMLFGWWSPVIEEKLTVTSSRIERRVGLGGLQVFDKAFGKIEAHRCTLTSIACNAKSKAGIYSIWIKAQVIHIISSGPFVEEPIQWFSMVKARVEVDKAGNSSAQQVVQSSYTDAIAASTDWAEQQLPIYTDGVNFSHKPITLWGARMLWKVTDSHFRGLSQRKAKELNDLRAKLTEGLSNEEFAKIFKRQIDGSL